MLAKVCFWGFKEKSSTVTAEPCSHAEMTQRMERRGRLGEKLPTWHRDCCDSWSDASISVTKRRKKKPHHLCCCVYADTHPTFTQLPCSLLSLQNVIQKEKKKMSHSVWEFLFRGGSWTTASGKDDDGRKQNKTKPEWHVLKWQHTLM